METHGLIMGMRVVLTDSETDDRGIIQAFDDAKHSAWIEWDHAGLRLCDIDLLIPEAGW